MNTIPPLGAMVRRIESPAYGLSTVAAIETATEPPSLLLNYAEGGDGWWPLDCVELVPASQQEGPA